MEKEILRKKIRLIYLPFLIMTCGFVIIYTFLNWVLTVKTSILSLNEDITNFFIPAAFSFIAVLIWLRPRIKLLKFNTEGRRDPVSLYIFIAVIAITIPTIIAQNYMETATGKLTALENISQIEKHEPSKYYTLKNFYIDKKHIGVYTAFDVSGKSNDEFNMYIYIVLPILQSEADTFGSTCMAWVGVRYFKSISNRLDNADKQAQFREFANDCQIDFDNKDMSQFIYLDKVGNTNDGDEYKRAVEKNLKYAFGNAPIFTEVNSPFEDRNGNKLAWIFGSFGIGGGIWLIMLLIPAFNEEKLKKFEDGETEKNNSPEMYKRLLLPREGYVITPFLIYVNTLVFLVMVFKGLGFISFKPEDLLNWGANFRPYTSNGQWWRLLTNTFLHGGIMHIVANMYGLLFVGIFLEPVIGKTKYLIAYLLTGIIASCVSIWWYSATISVGASGAIFGLYGVFLALLLTKVFPRDFSKAFLISTMVFIGYNLLMGISGGIDNAAHIGGLLSGFIIGLILYPTIKKQAPDESKLNTLNSSPSPKAIDF